MISVVTVTRDNVGGLRKTAASVLAQTRRDFEWIVIDGGSADGTVEFVKGLARLPDYFVSERDVGIYDAMNKGIACATGEYVICLNAGDVFHEAGTLEKVLSHRLSADVVYGDWVRQHRHHKTFCPAPKTLPPLYFFMHKGRICHQAMFVRTRLLKDSPFDARYFALADLAKWRRFMLDGRSFRHVPVTVCDFEACTGASAMLEKTERDECRLRRECPDGILERAAVLERALEMPAAGGARAFWWRVAWLPRKMLGGLKCLEEHGWSYTANNLWRKCRSVCGDWRKKGCA